MKLKNLFFIVSLLAIMFFLFMPAHAIFGLEKMFKGIVSAEVSAVRQDIKGDMNGVKADIKGDANGIKADIQKLVDLQIKMDMKLSNTMTSLAGANNTIQKMSAGRDMTTTTTNDGALMKFIFGKIIYVIGLIIGLIGSLILSYERLLYNQNKGFEKQMEAKDLWISNLSKSNDDKDAKMDNWFQEKLGKVLNGNGEAKNV